MIAARRSCGSGSSISVPSVGPPSVCEAVSGTCSKNRIFFSSSTPSTKPRSTSDSGLLNGLYTSAGRSRGVLLTAINGSETPEATRPNRRRWR